MMKLFKECDRFEDMFPFKKVEIVDMRKTLEGFEKDYVPIKSLDKNWKKFEGFHQLFDQESKLYRFLRLPELSYNYKNGFLDKLTLCCLMILWCKDSDVSESNKEKYFKWLSRDISIKYLIERMIRLSTLLVYGRLKDFNINQT